MIEHFAMNKETEAHWDETHCLGSFSKLVEEETECWTRTPILGVPIEKQSQLRGKTQDYKGDCVNGIQMQKVLVIYLDSEMALRVCEEVNGLGGLMALYLAWIMIESQYSK